MRRDRRPPRGPAAPARKPDPVVRTIAVADIGEALAAGLRDFQAAPLFGLFFGGIYALGGIAIVMAASSWGMLYLAYPLAAGFALIGPFVAVGLYEVSRMRERGETLDWRAGAGRRLRPGPARARLDVARHASSSS